MKCVFCEIVSGSSPAEKIYENDSVLAFLDINPMNFGHTLIIPKEHYPDFSSVPVKVMCEIIIAAKALAPALKIAVNADGYNLVVNNGEAAGQSVYHFHFHVIPRFNSDFKMKLNLKKYSGSSISEYAEKIRKEINPQE